jgi:putative hemolysin
MWHIGSAFGFGGMFPAPRHMLKPRRKIIRDLCGLPEVLGRSGPFEIRLATTTRDIRKAQHLRYKVFFQEGRASAAQAAKMRRLDICPLDTICDHLLIIDTSTQGHFGKKKAKVVGTYRLLRRETAERAKGFYSQTEFDLKPLLSRHRTMNFLELGRSCVHENYRSKRVIELLWRGLWIYAKHHDVDALIGCASLPGTDPDALALPLSFLRHHASAQPQWQVEPQPGRGIDMARLEKAAINPRKALLSLPPLVKAYLRVGATFADEAVIDPVFKTIDVFTIMPLADIEARYIAHYGTPDDDPGAGMNADSIPYSERSALP